MVRVVEWATGDVHSSERRFLECAKRDLPHHWTVIHGLRIRGPRSDREADFLVLDPERGALVVEVKGGRIERKGGEWFSTDRQGKRHAIKNPADQAYKALYATQQWLKRSYSGRIRLRLEAAVAFPHVRRDLRDLDSRGLGPDLPIETVIFKDGMSNLWSTLDRIFGHFDMRQVPDLAQGDVDALITALEPPDYVLRTSVAARIDTDGKAIEKLTEEQARMLDWLEAMPRAAVEGAAGTGKTVLAELEAERLARAGKRVLLLCYNQALASWLRSRERGFEATSFHRFCRVRAQQAGHSFKVPRTNQDEFWRNEAPNLLYSALEEQPDDRYDAIIVDEAQDFREHWWIAVESALDDKGDKILYAFFDPHQDIYGGGPPDSFPATPFPLKRNCRNTRRIAGYAADLLSISYETRPGAPAGELVKSIPYDTPDDMVDRVRKVLHRLVNEEKIAADKITVLSTHSADKSHLASRRRLGNFHLVERPQHPTDIRFTSLHKFKGLESDVVLLVDVDGNPHSCTERHLYVAATRARTLLIVLEDASAAS